MDIIDHLMHFIIVVQSVFYADCPCESIEIPKVSGNHGSGHGDICDCFFSPDEIFLLSSWSIAFLGHMWSVWI